MDWFRELTLVLQAWRVRCTVMIILDVALG
jgi:hypothetical protein